MICLDIGGLLMLRHAFVLVTLSKRKALAHPAQSLPKLSARG